MKRFIKLLVLTSLLVFISCGESNKEDSGKITITFWHSFVPSTIQALNELVEKFEKEHPDITIKAQYIPSGDALIQKLITAVQSESAPDISWLHSDYFEDLVEADAIHKMDDFIKGENGISDEDINDIYPSLIQYSKWKGTLYSLPMEATNMALLYNKEMFRKAGLQGPPKTWDEFFEYSKKLTLDNNNDGKNDQTGFFVPIFPAAGPRGGWMVWQWMPFLWQAGGEYINADQSQVTYNSEAGIAALTLWQNIYRELDLRTFTSDFDVTFASGRLAMAMDGSWSLPNYKSLFKNLDWGFAPLPAGPDKQATIVGGEYLSIFKQSKHPEAAWKFVKWIIQPDVQAFWATRSGYLPIRHAALEVPEFQKYLEENPNYKVFIDQMEVGYAMQPIDYGGLQITQHVAEAIEKATIGNMDVRTSLNQSAAKSNALLKKSGKK
ncbi:MAG: ABC transporter substrate-binding protein [Ignavibacteriaceae bacterium]